MLLEKTKIYGVDGVGQSSPTLTRTDSAVGLSYEKETSIITSDFDNCYPWSEMKEITDDFGNVFIRIPKFYTKITKNSNGTFKHQISGCRYDGFGTLFVDGKGNELDYILVGKYEGSYDSTNSRMMSKSGETVKVNITLPAYRTACKAVGDGYQQYDFLIDAIIKELFMIEFATTNSQSIMRGYVDSNSAALITGHTDKVKTPSGSYNTNHDLDEDPWTDTACHTDGHHANKYRGIENPWGNVWKWCDGINFDKEKIYVCESPSDYDSTKYDAPYTYMGDRVGENGWIKEVAIFPKNPLLGFASKINAGESLHFCDYHYYLSTGTILYIGGNWSGEGADGLWSCNDSVTHSFSGTTVGGRLCYKPL